MSNLFLAAAVFFGLSSAFAEEPLHFQGAVQFWHRDCAEKGCPIPVPLADPQTVDFTLDIPAGPQSSTFKKIVLTEGELSALVSVFVLRKDAKPFTVVQMKLSRAGKPLAECNQYHSLEDSVPFPVGVCSGFQDVEQWGMSLAR